MQPHPGPGPLWPGLGTESRRRVFPARRAGLGPAQGEQAGGQSAESAIPAGTQKCAERAGRAGGLPPRLNARECTAAGRLWEMRAIAGFEVIIALVMCALVACRPLRRVGMAALQLEAIQTMFFIFTARQLKGIRFLMRLRIPFFFTTAPCDVTGTTSCSGLGSELISTGSRGPGVSVS